MQKGEKYENPYLNEVIFRIDFSNISSLYGNKEASKDFHKKISKEFPNTIIKRNHEFNIGIDVNTGKPTQISSQEGNFLWVFKNRKHDKSVELTSKSLILHYNKGAYTHFRYFIDDVMLLLNALKDYNPQDLSFLGLRYINQIDGKTMQELKKCINPKYFNDNISNLEETEEFIQVLDRLSIKKENYILNFQYGLFNAAYPDPNFDKDFILDLDCTTTKVKTIDDVVDELRQMNKYVWNKFEDAITDSLRDEMNKEEKL